MAAVQGLRNKLLLRLPPGQFEQLSAELEPVQLQLKEPVYARGQPVPYVYFPNSGVISTVIDLDDGDTVETGLVGREGMSGVSVGLGRSVDAQRAFCQIPGEALRIQSAVFVQALEKNALLRQLVLRYANVVMATLAQNAACNRSHSLEERLARWLLITHDRVDGDEFPLTQEFLAQMLGVRRPTVSLAGAALQKEGVIRYSRGRITIRDRARLEATSCRCYHYIRTQIGREFDPAVDT